MFTPGETVRVTVDGVPQYIGTIVGYTRNGSFRDHLSHIGLI